ncbi:acetyl-CoA synthetase-like protein [Aspergillus uvarum CBS 121591]|uniref:Acetyl-CoA synthetase-like protein n=1 Tax=Aspergillus uvarum CBS 121591 TaxID=1448315 RepID=A0A319C6J5_9EURO|nr:acetyl-CoA synthetase-like protein [Aspergillus uvarum CBS 121591]PYH80935.1 acetyl-CoA synthetase-like protein [Aspergillus uvarum CBS 121591]
MTMLWGGLICPSERWLRVVPRAGPQPINGGRTLGELIDLQEAEYGSKVAVVVPWQSVRLSYRQLGERSRVLAQAMLNMGLRPGDCVGIMAGNCYQYIEVFLESSNPKLPELRRIVLIGDGISSQTDSDLQPYDAFTRNTHPKPAEQAAIARTVSPEEVLNLQFTSGTTGSPKAAMLPHTKRNLLNNARFVGQALALTPQDKILSPPPLFHCFGLVLGFMSSFIHGSTIIFPSQSFSATRCVDALLTERATVTLGVPTMYLALLDTLTHTGTKTVSLRTALASGSPVSPTLMTRLRTEMRIPNVLIAYGMTETSPVTFMTRLSDEMDKGVNTVGQVLPHTSAKVVDWEGGVVARGMRGELCTAGFAGQKGYWRNVKKTAEVMRRDEAGVLWMFTGDEAVMDGEGFVAVTGRIKDLIIRVSYILSDPYDGPTPPDAVLRYVQALLQAGCYEVSLGDTLDVGSPAKVRRLLHHLTDTGGIPVGALAGHFHDTYGQAVANIGEAYTCGVRVFDSCVAGLGGCPFAPGAKGNAATEDVVYMFQKAGVETGVDLARLVDTGIWIAMQLPGGENGSRAGVALAGKTAAKSPADSRPPLTALRWTLAI